MQDLRIRGCVFAAGVAALVAGACATTATPTPEIAPVGEAPTPLAAFDPPAQSPPASPTPVVAPPPPARTCEIWSKPQVLRRAPLRRLLDAGLGRWLQGVAGDRVLAKRRFQGWMIKSLHPGDPCYEAVDLQSGDIVQKVNGKSIERPEQAFDVAESLRSAPALTVDYLRDGKPRKLSLMIVDE